MRNGLLSPIPRKKRLSHSGIAAILILTMELEEWLRLYQALSVSLGAKERGYWTIAGVFLLANCLLAFPLAFVFFSYAGEEGTYFVTVLAGIGVLLSATWVFNQRRVSFEIAHFTKLLRSIEGQFAGGEFYRSLYKLLFGEEVCVPSTDWKCREWHPDVARIGWVTRTLPRGLLVALPVVFIFAWVAIAITGWLI